MLTHSHNVTMSQSSASSSIFVNVNGSAVPAAASHSVHANGSVVPAAASRPAHVQTADDITALMSNMSISKPTVVKPSVVKPTSASSTTSASKGCPPLRQHQQRSLANIVPSVNKATVSDRIAERRRRVIANITPGSKRPTLPVKATSSSSSRVSTPTTAIHPAPALTSQKLSSSPSAVAKSTPITAIVTPEPAVAANVQQPDVATVVSELISTFVSKSTVADVVSETEVANIVSSIVSALVAAAAAPPPRPDLIPITSEPIDPSLIPERRYGWIFTALPGSFRQQTEHKWTYNHIHDRIVISDDVWDAESRIPSVATGRRPRYQVPGMFRPAQLSVTQTRIPGQFEPVFMPHTTTRLPKHFAPVWLTCKPAKGKARGESRYCKARPDSGGGTGTLGYHSPWDGRLCICHTNDDTATWNIEPNEWATTPAESGRDLWPKPKKSNKKVRFAEPVGTVFPGEKPREQCLEMVPSSKCKATIEEDFPEGFCETRYNAK